MSRIFILRFPIVCSSFTNPKVSKIHVRPGELVSRNSDLIEIESEKGIFTLQAEISGVVSSISVTEEQNIYFDDQLLVILKD
jgi:biotin carboxyl carrier protein